MDNTKAVQMCKSCRASGSGKYCSQCGKSYEVKRITLSGLLHDVFHLFTHLDKGFGYTLKMLMTVPGLMQRRYVEGERGQHQKPFSMFFICATIAALSRYWIYQVLHSYYGTGSIEEATFFHEYMVLLHILLLPLHIFVIYLFFYRSGYNYAEIGVMVLYSASFFFLMATIIALFKFVWPELDTAYVELPVLIIYNAITAIRFFNHQPRWLVALKSTVILFLIFILIQFIEDVIVRSIG